MELQKGDRVLVDNGSGTATAGYFHGYVKRGLMPKQAGVTWPGYPNNPNYYPLNQVSALPNVLKLQGRYIRVTAADVDLAGLDCSELEVSMLDISGNKRLASLEGCPRSVRTRFDCRNTGIRSLKGGSQETQDYKCSGDGMAWTHLPFKVSGQLGVYFDAVPGKGSSATAVLGLVSRCKVLCVYIDGSETYLKADRSLFRQKLALAKSELKDFGRLS